MSDFDALTGPALRIRLLGMYIAHDPASALGHAQAAEAWITQTQGRGDDDRGDDRHPDPDRKSVEMARGVGQFFRWTEDRISMLQEMCRQGMSDEKIVAVFDGIPTRKSVSSQINRSGLTAVRREARKSVGDAKAFPEPILKVSLPPPASSRNVAAQPVAGRDHGQAAAAAIASARRDAPQPDLTIDQPAVLVLRDCMRSVVPSNDPGRPWMLDGTYCTSERLWHHANQELQAQRKKPITRGVK